VDAPQRERHLFHGVDITALSAEEAAPAGGEELGEPAHVEHDVAEVVHRAGFATPHHLAASLRAAAGQPSTELRWRNWAARSCQLPIANRPPRGPFTVPFLS